MQIEYNSQDKTIKIEDSIRQNFLLIYLLLVLNLINATVHLVTDTLLDQFSNWSYVWIFLGLISVFLLWFFLTKRTIKSTYEADSILHIERKSVGNRHRYRLVLHDRRIRELVTIIGEEEDKEVEEFEKIWSDIGIPIVKLQ